jgi:hypothetical protein
MGNDIEQERLLAVQRYLQGERPDAICSSLGRSRPWLYKWSARFSSGDPSWFRDCSRRPLSSPLRTPAEIEEIVKRIRLNLYSNDLFYGAQAIHWEMDERRWSTPCRPCAPLTGSWAARGSPVAVQGVTNPRGRRIRHCRPYSPTRPIRRIFWGLAI